MPRPFVFPDPNDRSANSPTTIVNQSQVLGLYKDATGERMERVTDKVKDWFISEALNTYIWDEAHFSGSQCVLGVNIVKRNIPE